MGITAHPCCLLQSLRTCIKNEDNGTFLQTDGTLINVALYKALREKILSTPSFRGEVKTSVPCRALRYVKEPQK
jgi:hypothetical protein